MEIKLPGYVEKMSGLHFSFNGDDVVIKKRVNGLGEKPPLYLWNLSRSVYISSLRELNECTFLFDVRTKGALIKYNLHCSESGQITITELK